MTVKVQKVQMTVSGWMAFPSVQIVTATVWMSVLTTVLTVGRMTASKNDSVDIVDGKSESRDECWIRILNEGVTMVFGNWYNAH